MFGEDDIEKESREKELERVPLTFSSGGGGGKQQPRPPPPLHEPNGHTPVEIEQYTPTPEQAKKNKHADKHQDPFAMDAKSMAAPRTARGQGNDSSGENTNGKRVNFRLAILALLVVLACFMITKMGKEKTTISSSPIGEDGKDIPATAGGNEGGAPVPPANQGVSPVATPTEDTPQPPRPTQVVSPPQQQQQQQQPPPPAQQSSSGSSGTRWYDDLPMLSSCGLVQGFSESDWSTPEGNDRILATDKLTDSERISCKIAYLVNTTFDHFCLANGGKGGPRCGVKYMNSAVSVERAVGPLRMAKLRNKVPGVQIQKGLMENADNLFKPVWVNKSGGAASGLLNTFVKPTLRADWRLPASILPREEPLDKGPTAEDIAGRGVYYENAIVLETPSCLTNLWHGSVEDIFPILDALIRTNFIAPLHGIFGKETSTDDVLTTPDGSKERPFPVAFFYTRPEPNRYGKGNFGCPSRNYWPYGFTPETWIGRMALHVLNVDIEKFTAIHDARVIAKRNKLPIENVSASELDLPHVPHQPLANKLFFEFERKAKNNKINPYTGIVRVLGKSLLGMPRTCTPYDDGSRLYKSWTDDNNGGRDPTSAARAVSRWPYYTNGAVHSEGGYCSAMMETFRRLIVTKEKVLDENGIPTDPSLAPDVPVSEDERRCPKVLMVRRGNRGNGRVLTNFDAIVAKIDAALAVQCPAKTYSINIVKLEHYSIREQIKMIHNSTIFVAARGAGTMNILFQRRGAGFLSLSVADKTVPVEKDQYPWYPVFSFLQQRHTVIMNCDAITDPSKALSTCLQISRNYCDMKCDVLTVEASMARLLKNMMDGAKNGDAPPASYEGIIPAVELRGGKEYFV